MRHAPSTLYFSHRFRPAAAGAIEWEELPSLASSVGKRGQASTVWDATRPAGLDPLPVPPSPFREALSGIAVREVSEPDVFRHFFGS